MQLSNTIRDIQAAIEEESARGYNTKLLRKALKQYNKAYKVADRPYKMIKRIEKAEKYVNRYRKGEKW